MFAPQDLQYLIACLQSNTKKSRRNFKPDEDARLKDLVSQLGDNNWEEVAQRMPGRNSRQCRDRWTTYLSPSITKEPWTPEEDALLTRLFEQFGAKWVLISKYMPGRSDNATKNRWYTHLAREKTTSIKPKLEFDFTPPLQQEHHNPIPSYPPSQPVDDWMRVDYIDFDFSPDLFGEVVF